ncbi:MAG: hypothetical protein R2707_01160 [Acidimicrobiales bacterium]
MAQSSRDEVDDLAENEQVFGFLLALHGVVHLLGWVISWRLFEIQNFHYDDVWPAAGSWPGRVAGLLWLVAAVSLAVVGTRLAMRRPVTRMQLVGPLTLSLAMTLTSLPSALPGTAVSGSILLAMAVLAARRARLSP